MFRCKRFLAQAKAHNSALLLLACSSSICKLVCVTDLPLKSTQVTTFVMPCTFVWRKDAWGTRSCALIGVHDPLQRGDFTTPCAHSAIRRGAYPVLGQNLFVCFFASAIGFGARRQSSPTRIFRPCVLSILYCLALSRRGLQHKLNVRYKTTMN